jgi:nicotinate-nucleotide adenylyltransferase
MPAASTFGRIKAQPPYAAPGQVIGLLGGSFNPPHAAHLLISETALKRLGLDKVWWIVSPGNPLKNRAEQAPLAERMVLVRASPRTRASRLPTSKATCRHPIRPRPSPS